MTEKAKQKTLSQVSQFAIADFKFGSVKLTGGFVFGDLWGNAHHLSVLLYYPWYACQGHPQCEPFTHTQTFALPPGPPPKVFLVVFRVPLATLLARRLLPLRMFLLTTQHRRLSTTPSNLAQFQWQILRFALV